MGWLHRLRLRRAAKRYARHLGPHLSRAYGLSEFYTPDQIRAAVAKTGLNPKFIVLGYASFSPEEGFAAVASGAPIYIPYQDARDLVQRFRPANLFSASANAKASNFVHYGAGHDSSPD